MTKIRKAAKGEDCTLRLFPYCNNNPETVVLCHLPSDSKGWAIKSEDYAGVFACSECHAILDGVNQKAIKDLGKEEIHRCTIQALLRTWSRLIELGIINIK